MANQVTLSREIPPSELIEQSGHIVDAEGIVVIANYFSSGQAVQARKEVRNLLIPTVPIRAIRVGSERILGRERTPNILQRRPISITRSNTRRYFSATVEAMFDEIDEINEKLLAVSALKSRFGSTRHEISNVILNRFAPNEEFEKHQDSRTNTGLTFILQTSPTLWHVYPEGPRDGMRQLDFYTNAGDLVIMAASNDNGSTDTNRHAGFTNYDPNGSVIHSGENLTSKNRFTPALFSTPIVGGSSPTR
jgi:DNA-binding protein